MFKVDKEQFLNLFLSEATLFGRFFYAYLNTEHIICLKLMLTRFYMHI